MHAAFVADEIWGFNACLNQLVVSVEAAKQGVTVGEYTMSALMFAGDFVKISRTFAGLQKQTEKALRRVHYLGNGECQRTRKRYAVVVCNEDMVNPVTFKWKWGENELLIADH